MTENATELRAWVAAEWDRMLHDAGLEDRRRDQAIEQLAQVVEAYTERQNAPRLLAECPDDVLEALLWYPRRTLDDDGNLTDEAPDDGAPGLWARSTRLAAGAPWDEHDPALEANGAYFDDDWEYAEPTHWLPMPPAPERFKQR